MVKIAIIGAHGTGKTSFIDAVRKELVAKGLVVRVVNEAARDCPLPINRPKQSELSCALHSQMWILCEHLRREIEAVSVKGGHADVVLCDRSIIDMAAYIESIFKETLAESFMQAADWLVEAWFGTYDRMFLLSPSMPIFDDGVRDTDPKWQAEIHRLIKRTAFAHHTELEEITMADIKTVASIIRGLAE